MRGAEVAMIFQDASASLDPTWSVGDQIAEACARTDSALGTLKRALSPS
jgi:ABC-type dipeptide/oligopeptide/nickel transport system ATPase component